MIITLYAGRRHSAVLEQFKSHSDPFAEGCAVTGKQLLRRVFLLCCPRPDSSLGTEFTAAERAAPMLTNSEMVSRPSIRPVDVKQQMIDIARLHARRSLTSGLLRSNRRRIKKAELMAVNPTCAHCGRALSAFSQQANSAHLVHGKLYCPDHVNDYRQGKWKRRAWHPDQGVAITPKGREMLRLIEDSQGKAVPR